MDIPQNAARTPRASGLAYEPALDGIRAVAVLAVLLYHSGIGAVSGGFLGVDLFFVLSGYLITSLLILEHESTGRIALGAFWMRRARRLLPALAVTMLVTALYAKFLADPREFERIRGDSLATLAYVSNWWFVFRGTSYWEQFTASPLRHTWSLGIEEQWYIFWPLLILPLLRRFGARLRSLSTGTIAAALCSALLMAALFDPTEDPTRIYFGTDTRAQALLLGAALAFGLHKSVLTATTRTIVIALGGAGAVTVLLMFAFVKDWDGWMYRGGFLLMASASAALIAGCVQPGKNWLRTALSNKPLVAIGKMSYGLYLYHWPMFVMITPGRSGLHGDALTASRLVATFLLAAISYRFIEMPVRHAALRAWGAGREVFAMASMVVVAGAIVVAATAGDVYKLDVAVQPTVRPGDLHVLVIGDSVAKSLGYGFDPDKYPGLSVTFVGVDGCGVMRGRQQKPGKPPEKETCKLWDLMWNNLLGDMRPDVSLIVAGGWESWDWWVQGELLKFGTPEFFENFKKEMDLGVSVLRARGSKVVLMTPSCYRDPFHPEPGAYPPADRHKEVTEMFEEYGRRRKFTVSMLDFASFVCPGGEYKETLNGVQMRSDGSHFTKEGSALIWTWLGPQLLKLKS